MNIFGGVKINFYPGSDEPADLKAQRAVSHGVCELVKNRWVEIQAVYQDVLREFCSRYDTIDMIMYSRPDGDSKALCGLLPDAQYKSGLRRCVMVFYYRNVVEICAAFSHEYPDEDALEILTGVVGVLFMRQVHKSLRAHDQLVVLDASIELASLMSPALADLLRRRFPCQD